MTDHKADETVSIVTGTIKSDKNKSSFLWASFFYHVQEEELKPGKGRQKP
jgi:hypothetical protein